MKLERAILEVLFNDIDPQYVINHILTNGYGKNDIFINFSIFYRSSLERFKTSSMNEIEKIYNGLDSQIDFRDPRSFFKYLGKFMSTLLEYDEYEPKVKYEMLMRWNKISHILGQDLLTMAFLAYRDFCYNDWTEFFSFKSVISTNNRQLHNILDQGLAENHFHLKGSTQVFNLNWLSLMNHPYNREREFKKFTVKLKPFYKYDSQEGFDLHNLIKLASILRAYFFIRTNQYSCKKSKHLNVLRENNINLTELDKDFRLKNKFLFFDKYMKKISTLKGKLMFKAYKDLDYALLGYISMNNKIEDFPIVGERKLLYTSINMMLSGEMSELEGRYFYLYILIKNTFRRELIQVNNTYGFSNFSDYEQRKEVFIEKYKKYQNALIKLALEDTLHNQKIVSLEARIAPKNSVKKNINYIRQINHMYENDKLFYVFHFIKKKESINNHRGKCRNYKVRKEVEHISKCLAKCFEINDTFKNKVKGIDACNNEYYCRPEVFAQSFRFLSDLHINSKRTSQQTPIEIFKTYHVGEDFNDIADGLRAIDEAILFCGLTRGSRLGHATVLGLNIDEYYEKKDRIMMTKLDFVDNTLWLFKKASSLNINLSKYPCCKVLKTECYRIMDEIYEGINDLFDEDIYYQAWMLRGDNPERYNPDGTIKNVNKFKRYNYYDLNVNMDNYRTQRAGMLYYAYHYNEKVKERGQGIYDFKIIEDYISLLKEIQFNMRFEIARKGIFIECNPTSNYLIANLRRYENHPIITFYNYELYNGQDQNCAQINVSINTDDQGVFDTSLENEYALMAYALENCRDKDGIKFTPDQVYKWIDSIRKMGIQQKFKI